MNKIKVAHYLKLTTALLAISCTAWLGLLAQDKTEAEKRLGPPPTKEFVEGFEAGVRYGLMARMDHPNEDDIPTLTKHAIYLYAMIARGGWKDAVKQP